MSVDVRVLKIGINYLLLLPRGSSDSSNRFQYVDPVHLGPKVGVIQTESRLVLEGLVRPLWTRRDFLCF